MRAGCPPPRPHPLELSSLPYLAQGSVTVAKSCPIELCCLNWGRKLFPLIYKKTDFSVQQREGGRRGTRGQKLSRSAASLAAINGPL